MPYNKQQKIICQKLKTRIDKKIEKTASGFVWLKNKLFLATKRFYLATATCDER